MVAEIEVPCFYNDDSMSDKHLGRVERAAALYDIHGNIYALKAVLEELRHVNPDLLIFGGDVAWGPWPKETVDLIRSQETTVAIRGNGDREVGSRLGESDGLAPEIAAVNEWAFDQLDGEQREWLLRLPETVSVEIAGLGEVLFCHGSPRSDEEMLTHLTAQERLADSLNGVREKLVVCGHTHMQFDRVSGDSRVVNAGSIGLPYEDATGAYWALLGPEVSLRRTEYDVRETAGAMEQTTCPHVQDFFAANVTESGNRTETAEHFESLAQKLV